MSGLFLLCSQKHSEKNTVEKTQWELIHEIIKGLLAQGYFFLSANFRLGNCKKRESQNTVGIL